MSTGNRIRSGKNRKIGEFLDIKADIQHCILFQIRAVDQVGTRVYKSTAEEAKLEQ